MDEPVPRRNFVRLVASDVVQNAGRIAALSGAAAGVVAQGVSGLTGAFDEQPAGTPGQGAPLAGGTAPGTSTAPRAAPLPVPQASAPAVAGLDDATWVLLAGVERGWLAVNRRNAGPLVLPTAFLLDGDRLSIRGRAGSAMTLAVAADGNVTLIVDDADRGQRCLVFGRAEVLEGAAAVSASGADEILDADGALIVIQPTHALRMPV
jgi:hypothetical protein